MYTVTTTMIKEIFLSRSYLGSTLITFTRFVAGLWSGEDTPSSWKADRTPKDLLRRSGTRILGVEKLGVA